MLLVAIFNVLLVCSFAAAQSSGTTPSNETTDTLSPSTVYPLTTDGLCGSNGRMCLANGTSPCCSSGGNCGTGPDYCTKPQCQEDYGSCEPNNATLGNVECSWAHEGTSPRCDGRCGAAFSNAICSANAPADAFESYGVYNYGKCCSAVGYCGSTSEHCSMNSSCQSGCGNEANTTTTAGGAADLHVSTFGMVFAFSFACLAALSSGL